MVIISVQGLSAFALAIPTGTVVVIKSAINTSGSGKCLDVAGGQTGTGTPIVQFDCHTGNNQRFVFERFPGGQYIIKSSLSSSQEMCVGIPDNVNANAYELIRLEPCRVNNDIPLGVRWYVDTINDRTRFRAL